MPRTGGLEYGSVGAIVVAAGASTRMGGLDKIFADLDGKPVVAHSIGVLEASPSIDRIVLVVATANLESGRKLVARQGWKKLIEVCSGGARRRDSVAAGLEHLDGCDWILVHDGARPFITSELIDKGLAAARRWGAAVPGVPVKDTVKTVDGEMVRATLDRASLVAVQTPQIFKSAIIKEAYARLSEDTTDDAGLVERLGRAVGVFEGSYVNIKITTTEDLAIARCFVGRQERASVDR